MRPMKKVAFGAVAILATLAATGTVTSGCAGKGADSPGNCEGADCAPSDSRGEKAGGGGDDDAPKGNKHPKAGGDEDKVGGNTGESQSSSTAGKGYDKDEISAKM